MEGVGAWREAADPRPLAGAEVRLLGPQDDEPTDRSQGAGSRPLVAAVEQVRRPSADVMILTLSSARKG
ncbi:hypothetical protein BE20_35630 [Sorangium cellulosum]|uniref:Uncharacterized protein n=1 Tax=Sorangium cellulosum TaxID=56 RepID=A0A150RIK5_SORCE|nr:hypothetical protein BE18_45390 [Sorangium cellulosum]KYF98277.1 hypothetical protein BE20_35630 [Sorangium cellulosum]